MSKLGTNLLAAVLGLLYFVALMGCVVGVVAFALKENGGMALFFLVVLALLVVPGVMAARKPSRPVPPPIVSLRPRHPGGGQ